MAAVSLLSAAAVATAVSPEMAQAIHLHLDPVTLMLFFGLFWATASVFSLFALYTETALFEWRGTLKATVKAVTAVLLVLVAAAAVLRPPLVTPAFLATYWFLACLGGIAVRWVMRRLLFLTEAQGIAARRTLVVGTNARAQEIALDMLAHPEHGYRFPGVRGQRLGGRAAGDGPGKVPAGGRYGGVCRLPARACGRRGAGVPAAGRPVRHGPRPWSRNARSRACR